MRKITFIMLFSFFAILTVQAQETPKESAKILNVKYKKPKKEDRKPEFNKYDSSFNKKLSRQKRKENTAKRKRAKANSKIREMEVQHNKRNIELARKMELREREAKR
jgi:Skp family chaperone for outer membrane proteins